MSCLRYCLFMLLLTAMCSMKAQAQCPTVWVQKSIEGIDTLYNADGDIGVRSVTLHQRSFAKAFVRAEPRVGPYKTSVEVTLDSMEYSLSDRKHTVTVGDTSIVVYEVYSMLLTDDEEITMNLCSYFMWYIYYTHEFGIVTIYHPCEAADLEHDCGYYLHLESNCEINDGNKPLLKAVHAYLSKHVMPPFK